jgi:hypothetical protein
MGCGRRVGWQQPMEEDSAVVPLTAIPELRPEMSKTAQEGWEESEGHTHPASSCQWP